jgi:hypothetical protein
MPPAQQREKWLDALREHQREITDLSRTLAELDRSRDVATVVDRESSQHLTRHITFVTAQVMRHRISMALLESRLAGTLAGEG